MNAVRDFENRIMDGSELAWWQILLFVPLTLAAIAASVIAAAHQWQYRRARPRNPGAAMPAACSLPMSSVAAWCIGKTVLSCSVRKEAEYGTWVDKLTVHFTDGTHLSVRVQGDSYAWLEVDAKP